MRVLFVIAHLGKGGGAQTQAVRVIREISKTNETLLLTLRSNGKGVVKAPCKTEFVGELKFPGGIFSLSRKIKEVEGDFDVVQCLDSYYSLPAFYLSGSKKPAFLRSGMIPVKDLQSRGKHLHALVYRALEPFFLSKIKKVMVNSRSMLSYYSNALFVPNGYDVNDFERTMSKTALRNMLNLPQDRMIAAYTGKVIPRKNLEVVFQAIKFLPDFHLLVIGETNEEYYGDRYFRMLKKKYSDILYRVTFVEEQPFKNMLSYLHASDVYVFPSRIEGSPNSVLEAMLCKLPVVCSDIPAHREIIEHEKTGLLFRSTSELVKHLGRLCDKKEQLQFGKLAYNFVAKHHNIKDTAEKYLASYKEALK
ncbi:MAG: glycosyltransferase family 4 protein [Candidatus Woesearchaeota archaeon]